MKSVDRNKIRRPAATLGPYEAEWLSGVLAYSADSDKEPREVVEQSLHGPHDWRVLRENVLRCVARLSGDELRWFAEHYTELDRRSRRRDRRP